MNYTGKHLQDYLDLTLDEYEQIAVERIGPALLKREVDLFNNCWFDYRFMHPTLRTYVFADIYISLFKEFYERHIDIDSTKARGFSRPDPLDNRPPRISKERIEAGVKARKLRTPTCLWRARQTADSLGMPYHEYIKGCFHFILQMHNAEYVVGQMKDKEKTPKLKVSICHFYSDYIADYAGEHWIELGDFNSAYSELEFYKFESKNDNHVYKLEHEKRILESLERKIANVDVAAANFVNKRLIRPEQVYKVLKISEADLKRGLKFISADLDGLKDLL